MRKLPTCGHVLLAEAGQGQTTAPRGSHAGDAAGFKQHVAAQGKRRPAQAGPSRVEAGRSWGQKELEASGQSVCRPPRAAPHEGLRPTALRTEKPQSGAVAGHPRPPGEEVALLITAFRDLLLQLKRPSQATLLSRDNVD